MSRAIWVAVGLGVAGLGGAVLYQRSRESEVEKAVEEASVLPAGLPMRAADLRRLTATEIAASIPGLARFLAVTGAGESNWTGADPWGARNVKPDEVAASQAAFAALDKQGVHLRPAAATWGSGGAFGLLAPYALIAGRPNRPFLSLEPDSILDPFIACAAATAMVVRLRQAKVDNWNAMRVAWKGLAIVQKDPSLTNPTAQAVLSRMADDVAGQHLDGLLPMVGPVDTSRFPEFEIFLKRLKEGFGE